MEDTIIRGFVPELLPQVIDALEEAAAQLGGESAEEDAA